MIPKSRGLYLTGPSGSGKTSLAVTLANHWNRVLHEFRKIQFDAATEEQKLRYYSADISAGEIIFSDHVMAIDWFALCAAYKTIHENRTEEQHRLIWNVEHVNPQLLWVLDDFAGASSMSDHVRDCTEQFIRSLYIKDATVIITSNLPANEAGMRWNEQIRSRLLEMCVQIKISGNDMRAL